MICLDTNYLILGLVAGSRESQELTAWIEAGEVLVAPMSAWYEFLCGSMHWTRTAVIGVALLSAITSHNARAQRLPTRPVLPSAKPMPPTVTPTAKVRGVVFDSVAMRPLPSAVVQIVSVDDPSRIRAATTDADGTFLVDSLPLGAYVLGFLHDRLDVLGIESAVHRVEIHTSDDVETRLVIPSAATLITHRCGNAPLGQAPSMFIGVVRPTRTITLSVRARVRAQWTEVFAGRQGLERRSPVRFTEAAENGFFAFCGVPTDVPILTRAFAGTDSSGVVELVAPANGLLVRDLYIGAAARVTSPFPFEVNRTIPKTSSAQVTWVRGNGQLRGFVRTDDGKPIGGARVNVWDNGIDATTNVDGQFTLKDLPIGTYTLETRALGFQPRRRAVDVSEGAEGFVDVVMDAVAPTLDVVKVKAGANNGAVPLAEFERRRKSGFGHFLDETQIEQRAAMHTADLFRSTPGMTILPGAATGDKVLMNAAGGGGVCVPAVFLNGVTITTDGNLDAFINPKEVRAIEIYSRVASVPLQFQSRNGCGSIVLWTGARRTTPPKP